MPNYSGVWSLQPVYQAVAQGNWPSTLTNAPVGLFGGGGNNVGADQNTIQYVFISSTGNAIDFGDLSNAVNLLGSCSSTTRGLFAGGTTSTAINVIEYVTISTAGNAADFGDLTVARQNLSGCSSSTRGLFGGGTASGSNVIDYVTIASIGNATDFGDLLTANQETGACSSLTRGIWAGGRGNGLQNLNSIDYVTIASVGNALDFGDLTISRWAISGCSSATRGLFAGGANDAGSTIFYNVIDYITIASTGNATDFGDLLNEAYRGAACSSSVRGVFALGSQNTPTQTVVNTLQYVTIASTGNATDFGDLLAALQEEAACSNSHGGL